MLKAFSPRKFAPALAFLLLLFSHLSMAQTPPAVQFNPLVTSGLSSPVDIENAGDGTNRIFIVQKAGTIRIFSGGALQPGNFLNISSLVTSAGERGLLAMAFHPDYENNRYFFVYYTNSAGSIEIARYRTQAANPNQADPASGQVLLTITKPYDNHNGGDMAFGPDGKLYFATGDGGAGGDPQNFSQNGNSLLGKMIRLDVDNFNTPPYYTIPADNPYVSNPAVRDEIYAMGLRNPWRWSFDRSNNDIWIADVGQGNWEEVNYLPFNLSAGVNYGWRCYEGNQAFNTSGCLPQASYQSPVFQYGHNAAGGYSITGGFVYRGSEFPALAGLYLVTDYVTGNGWLLRQSSSTGLSVYPQTGWPTSIAGFGEAENGELYAVTLSGTFYKIQTASILPVSAFDFKGKARTTDNELTWMTGGNYNRFDLEFSADGLSFGRLATISAVAGSSQYNFTHTAPPEKGWYRLKVFGTNSLPVFSGTVYIDRKRKSGLPRIYPGLVRAGGSIQISTGTAIGRVELYNASGQRVWQQDLNQVNGLIRLELPSSLASGLHWLRMSTAAGVVTEKLMLVQE